MPSQTRISIFFVFFMLISTFLISCGKTNFETQPGKIIKFACKTYTCELTTPNGTWYKPDQKNLSPDFIKQTAAFGEVFRINKIPGEEESKLANELAKGKGLSYFYVNYFLVNVTDLKREIKDEEAAKLIKSNNARQSEIQALTKGFENFQKISSTDIKISNIHAWLFEFKGNDAELKNAETHVKSAYFIKGHYLFTLQGMSLEGDKNTFFADYDKMAASFKIQK